MVEQLAGFWQGLLGKRGTGANRIGRAELRALDYLLREQGFWIAYQPVVDLQTQEIFAYEALARSNVQALPTPPAMFEAASVAKRVGELGRALRRMSIEGCTDHRLFINIFPSEFDESYLVQPNEPIFWHNEQVYIEITESVPLHYFEQCHGVLAEIRRKGIRLAVDDLGAGYSNLKYISDLSPEIVKMDRSLVAGVSLGNRAAKLLKSIVALCTEMGARVVVEGIETTDELAVAVDAGAHFGQGFLLAHPAYPPPAVVWPADALAAKLNRPTATRAAQY